MRRNHKLLKLSALGLIASVALPTASAVAQGSELAKPAAQIFADSVAAMEHLKDFYVSGTVQEGTELISLDLTMSTHGGGGSVSLHGATIDMVVTNKFFYMKADKHSWEILSGGASGSAASVALLANKWIKFPVSNAEFGSMADFSFSNKFLQSIVSEKMTFSKRGETTWDKRSAIVLRDSQGTNIYIAAKSPHYLLGVAGSEKGDKAKGSMTISDFGTALLPVAPVGAISLPT